MYRHSKWFAGQKNGRYVETRVRDNRSAREEKRLIFSTSKEILCLFALIIPYTVTPWAGTWRPSKIQRSGTMQPAPLFPPTPVSPCYRPMTTGTSFPTIKSDPANTRYRVARGLSKVAHHLLEQVAFDANMTRTGYVNCTNSFTYLTFSQTDEND